MARSPSRKRVLSMDLILSLSIGVPWVIMTATTLALLDGLGRLVFLVLALAAQAVALVALRWAERDRWERPILRLASQLRAQTEGAPAPLDPVSVPALAELNQAIRDLRRASQPVPSPAPTPSYYLGMGSGEMPTTTRMESMTRSGMLAAIPDDGSAGDHSGHFGSADMVCRIEPRTFRWLEATRTLQEFLGWDLKTLRERSFLEMIHPDDYPRIRDHLREALVKGEAHGLVFRVKTAQGRLKALEMDVGARYGPDLTITHLRCHLTDVTAKVRAERELKLRTRELEQVNEQLRQINRELEELKDRYRDLYQNAPVMYFSLDHRGRMLDCNETLLRTLGYRREELVGHSYDRLLPEARRPGLPERHSKFIEAGTFEGEGQWTKASGEVIDIWLSATAVKTYDGKFLHSRSVAQDVTARHRLEAELQEKNARLARTIEELSRKNKEMDEFTYVVSHDLQEPLRTLIAFSDFLLRDCGDRLDANGQEYVRYLVEASRRMRSLIHGLLNLSRAGRVTGDFAPVNLEDVVRVVKADLGELIRTRQAVIHTAGPLPSIWGDRDRIGQLMANLISNGVKYNRSSAPRVEVGTLANDAGPWVTIYVRDNGIGIDPQFHSKIFQLFRRLHTREEYEGTGAGLAICNKIVQAHGGRIWVESEPNHGATFFLSLRRAAVEPSSLHAETSHAS